MVECLFLIMTVRVHSVSRIDGPEVNTYVRLESLFRLWCLADELDWRHPLRRDQHASVNLIGNQL
jgi:hypothetical protein